MSELDKRAFELVDRLVKKRWKRFGKYFVNDSKVFGNKLSRDYGCSGKFPVHVLKMIKSIPVDKYDSAVCVLRGALPYSVIFEAYGWKVHYLICGRRNEVPVSFGHELRFSKSVDRSIDNIKGKKVLILENNSPSGRTPLRVAEELRRVFGVKKPDLFLDYFSLNRKIMPWLKRPFWKNEERLGKFVRVWEASGLKVGKKEREDLLLDFLDRVRIIVNLG